MTYVGKKNPVKNIFSLFCCQCPGVTWRAATRPWRSLDVWIPLPRCSSTSPSPMAAAPPKSKTPPSPNSTPPPSRLPLPCSPASPVSSSPSFTARLSNHSSCEPSGGLRGGASVQWAEYGGMPAAKAGQHKTNGQQLPYSSTPMPTHISPPHTHGHTHQTHSLSPGGADSSRTRSPGREEVNRLFGRERRYGHHYRYCTSHRHTPGVKSPQVTRVLNSSLSGDSI